MKTKQVHLRRLLVFAVALVVGMLVFPSVVPYLAVRVFVPGAPPIRPARKQAPRYQIVAKQNPSTTKSQQLKTVEAPKVAADSSAMPQAILEKDPVVETTTEGHVTTCTIRRNFFACVFGVECAVRRKRRPGDC